MRLLDRVPAPGYVTHEGGSFAYSQIARLVGEQRKSLEWQIAEAEGSIRTWRKEVNSLDKMALAMKAPTSRGPAPRARKSRCGRKQAS